MEYKHAVTKIPESSWTFLKESFSKESIGPWALIISSTTLLYAFDEEILLEVQRWGRQLNIGNTDKTKSFIQAGQMNIFRGPTDFGSTLYFLGDGWMHAGIGLGFIGIGEASNDPRALNTGIQIFHGMFVSTLFCQILKRSTGRESPEVRTQKRGRWQLFPSFEQYNTKTPHYDAFPSGHVMTSVMTFTVIIENYPEYSWFLLPLEYTWVTLLSLQMINNGVHWASDYPLGIAMGYLAGKIVTRYGREETTIAKKSSPWIVLPVIEENTYGLWVNYRF